MQDLKIFESAEFGEIRAAEINGEPWFIAADVCRAKAGFSSTIC